MKILQTLESSFRKAAACFSPARLLQSMQPERLLKSMQRKKDMQFYRLNGANGQFAAMKEIVDTYPDAVHWRDNSNNTPLHHAATWRNAGMAAYYISKGADIEAVNANGYRPIHFAAQCAGDDPTAVLDLLIAKGAKIEVRNDKGETPLLFAVYRNKPWNAEALVRAGANVLAADLDGDTPMSMAQKFPSQEVYQAILKAQADMKRAAAEAMLKAVREAKEQNIAAINTSVKSGLSCPLKPLQRVRFKRG